MSKRIRKRVRTFEDVASVMEPGGEGFIIDPVFRIKLGTTPIIKDFKVRSYLNFMASLPMKYNPATKYFEFAETPEEITALCKAYFFAAEPGALADSGYDQFRINKARHLLVQPIGNLNTIGTGANIYAVMKATGETTTWKMGSNSLLSTLWAAAVVAADEVSGPLNVAYWAKLGVGISVDAACDVTVQISPTSDAPFTWYDHTTIQFTAAGSKAQDIMGTPGAIRLKVSAACTITAHIMGKA